MTTYYSTAFRRNVLAAGLLTTVAVMTCPSHAAVNNNWQGLGSSTTNPSSDITDPANWSLGHTPTAGERAVFNFNQVAGASGPLAIPAADTSFAPDALTVSIVNTPNSTLTINKDLTLTDITLTSSISSGTAIPASGRLIFANTNVVTLNLTGTTPIDATGGSFAMINTGTGTAATRTIFNFTNASISLPELSQTISKTNDVPMNGGIETESATDNLNSEVNFTAVAGSIHIATAGARAYGNLAIGNSQLNVRSDQTWTSDPTGFIRLNYHPGPAGAITNYPIVIGSLNNDGSLGATRLDNLGQLHIVLDANGANNGVTAANGMRFGGGTYGSLLFDSTASSRRTKYLVLSDDVELDSAGVQPGTYNASAATNVNATTTPYGLTFYSSGGNGQYLIVKLAGYALKVDQGVSINDQSGAQTAGFKDALDEIDATGSTLNIGGDLNIYSANQSAAAAKATIGAGIAGDSRAFGLVGNASTIVNLAGSFIANTASVGGAALSTSTVNLVGGATPVTYEVGDAIAKTAVITGPTVGTNQGAIAGGFSIGTLNVGTALAASNVTLVNNYLNDNAVVAADGTVSNAGEKLIAATLNVNAGSTLDVNAQSVLVYTALSVAGTLNLDSGLALNNGDLVPNFVGNGDQSAVWDLSAANVSDSSNPADTFIAFFDGTNTYWQAVASVPVPEPASLALLGLGAATLLTRRRRYA